MSHLATTKLSSKGQVVIPEEIREKMGLRTGTQFIVIAENDVVILKTITPPSMSEFDSLITTVRRQAKSAKLDQKALNKAIMSVRKSGVDASQACCAKQS